MYLLNKQHFQIEKQLGKVNDISLGLNFDAHFLFSSLVYI